MLIFRDSSPETYAAMTAAEREQAARDWYDWYDGLISQGKVTTGHPLEAGGRVVSGRRGERVVDGPFAEAKEAIGGFFMLTVATLDEATEIARQCPNLKHGMNVEVRQVRAVCPLAEGLDRPPGRTLSHV
jgi:hypothetical protein